MANFRWVELRGMKAGDKQENTRCAITDIFVILILNTILFGVKAFAEVREKLYRFFVHTNNRIFLVIRTAVYAARTSFHCSHKHSILLRRNAPTLFQIRLTFIFLSTDETVE